MKLTHIFGRLYGWTVRDVEQLSSAEIDCLLTMIRKDQNTKPELSSDDA